MWAERLRQGLSRLGVAATARPREGEPFPVTAVVQPVGDRSKSYLEPAQTPSGVYAREYAVGYLLPEERALALAPGDRLTVAGEQYRLRRTAVHRIRGEPVYLWCVLLREEERDAEGSL